MTRHLAIALLVLLAACEARVGKETESVADNEAANAAAPAEGEAGQFSLKVPGFEMKVDMPDEGVRTGDDGDMLYPGSRMTGMNIDAGEAGREDLVELRFRTTDNIRQVAAWYRDPARKADFSLSSVTEEGESYRLAGTQKDGDGSFDLWLSPSGGGTNARLVFRDQS